MKRVKLPLDHLAELWPQGVARARLGASLHPASVSASLAQASQILAQAQSDFFWSTPLRYT